MSDIATGVFELNWDQKPPYDSEPGATISRVTVTKQFRGDITGSSVAELITAMTETPDSAGYVGIERFNGDLNGKLGSFVLQHSAVSTAKGGQSLFLEVVPDSATGDLVGLRGAMEVEPSPGEHKYTLRYYFED
jgi:hypothetical protein